MYKMKSLFQSALLAFSLLALMSPSAQAGMVGTQQLIDPAAASISLSSERETIRQQLVELGVEPVAAAQRAASLSEAQIAEIDQRLAEMPAGADVGSVILTVFIVFVITDVIGATDIFPFIKPVR